MERALYRKHPLSMDLKDLDKKQIPKNFNGEENENRHINVDVCTQKPSLSFASRGRVHPLSTFYGSIGSIHHILSYGLICFIFFKCFLLFFFKSHHYPDHPTTHPTPANAFQYRIGQLYMISKHSCEQSGGGEGVEVVKNEPDIHPQHGLGQLTEKRIYLNRYRETPLCLIIQLTALSS